MHPSVARSMPCPRRQVSARKRTKQVAVETTHLSDSKENNYTISLRLSSNTLSTFILGWVDSRDVAARLSTHINRPINDVSSSSRLRYKADETTLRLNKTSDPKE